MNNNHICRFNEKNLISFHAYFQDADFPEPSRALMTARQQLGKAVERITELEETLLGKQELAGRLLAENEQLRYESKVSTAD